MNPFKFGLEVSGNQFYDRIEAAELLHRRLAGGASNVVMYAPRRYGKTSLVKKVLARFRAEGLPAVYFDLSKVDGVEKFCEEYSSALCSIAGRFAGFADTMKTYLSHLHPTFSFGGELPVSVRLDYGDRITANSVSEVLDLAEKVAVDVGANPLVIALDEFQEIGRLSSDLPLEAVFRSRVQAHEHVRYVFFGSKTHMLMRMFGNKARPFYKSASTIKLDKPPKQESIDFVIERFASVSIEIDDVLAKLIVESSENIPYYLQQLSSIVYEKAQTEGRDHIVDEDIHQAEKELVAENADYYSEMLSSLSNSQRSLVAALAWEPAKSFKEAYRRRYSLGGSSTVNTALKVIREVGIVESDDDGYHIGDPFFAKYIRSSAASID